VKGLWASHYVNATESSPYGDVTTYYRGAMWLAGCASVEDWGCGLGYFKTCMMYPERVTSVDGSWSRFADEIADLRTYRSAPEGLFMRHVLEHNLEWRAVLDNALASFTKRMVLVMFTPFSDTHRILGYTRLDGRYQTPVGPQDEAPDPTKYIPDQSFTRRELAEAMGDYLVKEESLVTKTQYGGEDIFYLSKEKP
jgi:hypothetical protein